MPQAARSERSYGGIPPEERRRERRARLVDAGLVLFGTKGYVATTIEQLCGEAGLNKRYFYESFRSTEELLAAVYREVTARIQVEVSEAVATSARAGGELVEQAVAGITRLFQVIDDDRRSARILLSELLPVNEVAREAIRSATQGWMAIIATVLDGYSYRGHSNELVAASVWGLLAGSAIRWALDDFREPVEELTKLIADVLTDIMATVTRV